MLMEWNQRILVRGFNMFHFAKNMGYITAFFVAGGAILCIGSVTVIIS